LLLDAEEWHGYEYAQRQRSRGRERGSRRLIARNDGAQARCTDKYEERAQKTDIFLRVTQAYVFNLFLDAGDDDFQRFCQRERSRPVESLRVMSLEPPASTSISPHVNTMVALSLNTPYCQKTI